MTDWKAEYQRGIDELAATGEKPLVGLEAAFGALMAALEIRGVLSEEDSNFIRAIWVQVEARNSSDP